MPPNPTKQWIIEPVLTPESDQALVRFSPILRQLLFNRGYKTDEAARQYLEAQPPTGSDPLNMLGVPEAVERIWQAIQKEEQIAIYGDYDCDGVTSSALLTRTLRALKLKLGHPYPLPEINYRIASLTPQQFAEICKGCEWQPLGACAKGHAALRKSFGF